ncbi:hypothetical protein K1719_035106 [Acacia pycnantha]|nr:hypothetical protein K1719_035106 [Acacia pycnantha]
MIADSEIWKNLSRLWPQVVDKLCWELGDGELINFWYDKWLEDGGLIANYYSDNISKEDKEAKVRSMVGPDGGWDVRKLQEW